MVWYFFFVHPFQSFVFDNGPNSFNLTSNMCQYTLLFSCSKTGKTIPRLSISEHFLFQRKTTITHSFDHHIILSYCFNRHVGFQDFNLASHLRQIPQLWHDSCRFDGKHQPMKKTCYIIITLKYFFMYCRTLKKTCEKSPVTNKVDPLQQKAENQVYLTFDIDCRGGSRFLSTSGC